MKKIMVLSLGVALAAGVGSQANGMRAVVRLFNVTKRVRKNAVVYRVTRPRVKKLANGAKKTLDNIVKVTKTGLKNAKLGTGRFVGNVFDNANYKRKALLYNINYGAKKHTAKQKIAQLIKQFAKAKDALRVKASMAKFHYWTTPKVAAKLQFIKGKKAIKAFGASKVVPFVSSPYTALVTGVGTGTAATLVVPHCEKPVTDFVAKVAESNVVQSAKYALTTTAGDNDGAIL